MACGGEDRHPNLGNALPTIPDPSIGNFVIDDLSQFAEKLSILLDIQFQKQERTLTKIIGDVADSLRERFDAKFERSTATTRAQFKRALSVDGHISSKTTYTRQFSRISGSTTRAGSKTRLALCSAAIGGGGGLLSGGVAAGGSGIRKGWQSPISDDSPRSLPGVPSLPVVPLPGSTAFGGQEATCGQFVEALDTCAGVEQGNEVVDQLRADCPPSVEPRDVDNRFDDLMSSEKTKKSRVCGSSERSNYFRRAKRIKFQDKNAPPSRRRLGRLRARYDDALDWWMCLEEPPCDSCMHRFVHQPQVESICAAVIAFNTAFAIYTTNYEIDNISKDPTDFMVAVELGLVCFYGTELGFKLIAHGRWFFLNEDMSWNILDLLLVVQSVYEQAIVLLLSSNGAGVNLSFMRSMRILKVAKVLRVVKVLRFFTALRLILNSVIGSLISMLWSFVMLAMIFLIFGLVFVQGCSSYLSENGDWLLTQQPATHQNMFASFGSVQVGMLTLFKTATGVDWVGYFDLLALAGNTYGAAFIMFIGFYQIAVINILTGIFVDSALKLAVPDRDARALSLKQDDEEAREELFKLLREIDIMNTGIINVEDFAENLKKKNGKLQAQMTLLGLPVDGARNFFRVVSVLCGDESMSNEEEANIQAFVECCLRLKGTAANLHLQCVAGDLVHITVMLQQQLELCEMLTEKLAGNAA